MAITPTTIPVTLWDGGLKQDKSTLAIEPKYMSRCRNITLKDGVVHSRTGLVYFYPASGWQQLAAGPEDTIPDIARLGFYHHEDFENVTKRFWHFGIRYDGGTHKVTAHWYDIANTRWSLAAGTGSDSTAGTVTASGYDYWMNVCSVVNDANTDGTPDADGEFLILNVTPTANTVSQGSYLLQYNKDAGSGQFTKVSLNGEGAVNYQCKRVLFFNGRLVLLGTNLHEIKWSQQWDHDDILSTEAYNYYYAYDTGGAIMNGALLKDEMVCYKEDAIYSGYAISSTPFIRWNVVYPDIGLLAPRLLAVYGNLHFFVGNNNIYMYGGGSELYPIGTPIWSSFLSDLRDGSADASGNQLYKRRSFASVHRDTGEIAFWIPTGSAQWPNVAYVFNVFQRNWVKWVLPDNADTATHNLCVTGWGEYEHDTNITDSEFIPFYTCCQSKISDGTVNYLRCAKYDSSTRTDMSPAFAEAGTAATRPIDAWAETKDFMRTMQDDTDWLEARFDAKGYGSSPTLSVGISQDDGTNYNREKTLNLETTKYDRVTAQLNMANYKARLRVRSNTSATGFSVRAFEVQPSEAEAGAV